MTSWTDEYRRALRKMVSLKGVPVQLTDPDNDVPELRVSTYGWQDFEAWAHARQDKCAWVIPDNAEIAELTYSEFTDTDVPNTHTVGVNITPAACSCGRYTGVTLRVDTSLREALDDMTSLMGLR